LARTVVRSEHVSSQDNGLKVNLCRVHRRHPAATRHFAQALLTLRPLSGHSLRTALRSKQMSKHVRAVPSVFLHYHGLTLLRRAPEGTPAEDAGRQLQQTRGHSCQHRASSVLLRDDHIVLLAIDALLALHTLFKKWRKHRRTLRELADLDDHQLRDIGLTRDGNQNRSLARSDEA
jgi:hypothetical protein